MRTIIAPDGTRTTKGKPVATHRTENERGIMAQQRGVATLRGTEYGNAGVVRVVVYGHNSKWTRRDIRVRYGAQADKLGMPASGTKEIALYTEPKSYFVAVCDALGLELFPVQYVEAVMNWDDTVREGYIAWEVKGRASQVAKLLAWEDGMVDSPAGMYHAVSNDRVPGMRVQLGKKPKSPGAKPPKPVPERKDNTELGAFVADCNYGGRKAPTPKEYPVAYGMVPGTVVKPDWKHPDDVVMTTIPDRE